MPQRLVENIRVSGSKVSRIPLTESSSKVKVEEQQLDVSSAFEVPIWRIGERNLNNRTYGSDVAQKVVQENKTTVALADHPKDEGSVWNIVAVAKNPKIRDGILWAESYFVDEQMAKKVEKIVEYGGEVGLSSSAYGDVDEDGNVLHEGFEIDRYFDLVLEPSYQVYIGKESNKIDPSSYSEQVTSDAMPSEIVNPEDENETEEEKRKKRKNKPSDEEITIDNETNSEGGTKESSMKNLEKIHEANFRMNIRSLIQDAESKESLVDQRNAYRNILGFMEEGVATDLQEDVNSRIEKINEEIESYAEKGVQLEEVKTQAETATTEKQQLEEKLEQQRKVYESKISTLQTRYEKANETIDSLREKIEQKDSEVLEATAARNGRVKAEDYVALMRKYRETTAKIEAQNNRIEQLLSETSSEPAKVHKGLEAENAESEEQTEETVEESVEENAEETETVEAQSEEAVTEDSENKASSIDEAFNREGNSDGFLDLDFSNTDEVKSYFQERVAEDPRYEAYRDAILGCKTLEEAQIKAMNVDLDAVPTKDDEKPSKKVDESTRFASQTTNLDEEDRFMSRMVRKGWF